MSTSNSLHTCRAVESALQITATTAGCAQSSLWFRSSTIPAVLCSSAYGRLLMAHVSCSWCSLLHWSASVVMRQCCVWTYLLTWMSDRASFSSGRPSSLYLGWLLRWSITCKVCLVMCRCSDPRLVGIRSMFGIRSVL